ncbi:MAG: hypothetical protein OXP69_00620 [Spirochaetaceae bacterium]|nr:hypothetical protein [Spirochaetaceae bacterium]
MGRERRELLAQQVDYPRGRDERQDAGPVGRADTYQEQHRDPHAEHHAGPQHGDGAPRGARRAGAGPGQAALKLAEQQYGDQYEGQVLRELGKHRLSSWFNAP